MRGFLKDTAADATLALWREGYGFISRRCARLGRDVFRTRLTLRPALCARGAEAAEIFYAGDRFTRNGAMPAITLRLLQDKGSVQLLDGAAHRHRKAMLLGILIDDAQVASLAAVVEEALSAARPAWERRGSIELVGEMTEVLTAAAVRWTGLPAGERPSDAMARARHERYVRSVVRRLRDGSLDMPPSAPARIVAEHRDPAGARLAEANAAVEIINLLRPIVAVAWYVGFLAIALERHPE